MRLAHLILAHSNPHQLERLVKCLLDNDADIYIHIDKKTDLTPFLSLKQLPNVYFIEKRVKVYWGAYSVVEATLNGFKAIVDSKKIYGYINLLSGQDYPIQTIKYISDFLKANTGKAFMEFYLIEDVWKEAIPRLHKYYLTNYHFIGRHLLQKWINIILPSRKVPNSMVAVGRSQWFTITSKHIKYIIDFFNNNANVRRYFKLSWGADEFVFQTILFNSPYKTDMVNNNLRYIDWTAGGVSPKVLIKEDAEKILNSNKLFARKFNSEISNTLLDAIDNKIKQ